HESANQIEKRAKGGDTVAPHDRPITQQKLHRHLRVTFPGERVRLWTNSNTGRMRGSTSGFCRFDRTFDTTSGLIPRSTAICECMLSQKLQSIRPETYAAINSRSAGLNGESPRSKTW